MTAAPHLSPEELAVLALGFLAADRMQLAEQHLAVCAQCREELSRLRSGVVAFTLGAELHTPSAQVRERLLRRLSSQPRTFLSPEPPVRETAAPPEPPRLVLEPTPTVPEPRDPEPAGHTTVPRWLPWLGWVAILPLAAALAWQHTETNLARQRTLQIEDELRNTLTRFGHAETALHTLTDPQATHIGLHVPVRGSTPPPQGHVVYDPEHARLIFLASHLDPAPAGKTYQLWLLPLNGDPPLSVGLFGTGSGGSGSLVLPPLPVGVAAKGFGVTVEAASGSPTPTPPILLAGR